MNEPADSAIATGTDEVEVIDENLSVDDKKYLDKAESASVSLLESTFESISRNPNLAAVSEAVLAETFSRLASKVTSAPVISGKDTIVDVKQNQATIKWITDKEANSLVAYAKSSEYNPSRENPYSIVAGSPDENVLEHEVVLDNLTSNTTYHFQTRSKGKIGSEAISTDRTFTTLSVIPKISNIRFEKITETEALLKWNTDGLTKSTIEIKNTDTGDIKKIEDPTFSKEHSKEFNDLNISTSYTATVKAIDTEGNTSSPSIVPFYTNLSKGAPKVSVVKITSALVPERVETAQTIISWKTDKPATSRVFFSNNSSNELTQSTPLENALVKDHIVITTMFKPGEVYKIQVQSDDSAGNIGRSDIYNALIPKSKGSVVDIIMTNLDKTFGFLKSN
ncbi:MAG: fibronectin type III domain-containing protein [Candidatus Paceibacterota bacterium]|jgi:hypothetical protein